MKFKNKILSLFALCAITLYAKVESVHNSYYIDMYQYMAILNNGFYPIEWFPDNRLSRQSQANIAALYATSEIAAQRPCVTNHPATEAYSFTAAGMFEPLKQRDINRIASYVNTLADSRASFIYDAGPFKYTPFCFNPLQSDLFNSLCVLPGGLQELTGAYDYNSSYIGVGGRDLEWGNLLPNQEAPIRDYEVARKFAELQNGSGTNVVFKATAKLDNVDSWAQGLTVPINPWECTLTMQSSWLHNIAPVVGAFNTFFWHASGGLYNTSWRKRDYHLSAVVQPEKVKEALLKYAAENTDPSKWGVVTIDDCVSVTITDTGEENEETDDDSSWYISASSYSSGGQSLTLKGQSASLHLGAITKDSLENSGKWTYKGIENRYPMINSQDEPIPCKIYTVTLHAPNDLESIDIEESLDGKGNYYYSYRIPTSLSLSVGETMFGPLGFPIDKIIRQKSCCSIFVLQHQDNVKNETKIGAQKVIDYDFYDSLRGNSFPNMEVESAAWEAYNTIEQTPPNYDLKVTVDLQAYLNSSQAETLEACYFEDFDEINVYRITNGNRELLHDDSDVTMVAPAREVIAEWKNDFDEYRMQNHEVDEFFSLGAYGAVIIDSMIQFSKED
jgi:hypothetical protein